MDFKRSDYFYTNEGLSEKGNNIIKKMIRYKNPPEKCPYCGGRIIKKNMCG